MASGNWLFWARMFSLHDDKKTFYFDLRLQLLMSFSVIWDSRLFSLYKKLAPLFYISGKDNS
jgi:hypothetical protein